MRRILQETMVEVSNNGGGETAPATVVKIDHLDEATLARAQL